MRLIPKSLPNRAPYASQPCPQSGGMPAVCDFVAVSPCAIPAVKAEPRNEYGPKVSNS